MNKCATKKIHASLLILHSQLESVKWHTLHYTVCTLLMAFDIPFGVCLKICDFIQASNQTAFCKCI